MASPGHESESKQVFEAQLRATLDVIPAYTWYANPSGALTFVNKRHADFLGLPSDHPLRFGIDVGAQWDSHLPLLHPDDHDKMRKAWSQCLRSGCPGEVSFRARNAEGAYRWFLSRVEPLRASDGSILYWMGVSLDIEERKQAEFYLAEGERLAHIGSWAFNPAGFEYWSSELSRIYGLDPSASPPTVEEYLALVHPEDREFVLHEIQKMLAHHSPFEFNKRIIRPDGKIRRVHCVGVPMTSAGSVQRYVGTGLDVTEQEELTDELRRSEAYLAEAQRLSHTGSFGWKISSGEIFWSDETFRIFQGDPGTKLTVEFVLSRVHPEDRDSVRQQIDRASRDGEGFDFEHRLRLPDGSIKYVRVTAHPSRDSSGHFEFVGAVTDVSEQHHAQAVIREREAELRKVVDSIPAIVWSTLPDGSNTYVNKRFMEYSGSSVGQMAGSGWQTLIHPDDLERHSAKWMEAVATGKPHESEVRSRRSDGHYRWQLDRGVPLRDEDGNIVKWYGVTTDIEDRKRAEDKIREQEMEFRQMLDLSPQQVAVFGPNRERLYANRAALQYLGMSLEEWRERPTGNLDAHPDDVKKLKAFQDRGSSSYELEMRLRKGDGSFRWFLARFNALHDEKGRIMRWYVVCTDIDERKRAEERLQQENVALREEIDKASMFEEIVGTSPALKSVLLRISKVSPGDSTVLITGETGTGKELVARAIHRRSARSSRAFVSVNCAAVPRDLIASELFGHEKGSFTGATQQRLGRFELAIGGTLFVDEVGELPAETQIALLRVLQEHEFERVGGTRSIHADVRVIAATNRDLEAAISAGSFRRDLFYRLNVFPIEMPALRERKEDIRLLVEYFIDRYARKAGKNITSVDKETLRLFESYPWPGNIRELQNVIERSVIVCESTNFSVDESWLTQQPTERKAAGEVYLFEKVAAQEKEIIEAALRECQGRVSGPSGAAAKLGIARSTLQSKIRALKISKNPSSV